MLDRDLFDFLEHTADAAFAVNDDGEILSWNASAEALFGLSRPNALGRMCFEVLDGQGALGTCVCTERCHVRDCAERRTPVADFDLAVRDVSGRRSWLNLSTIVHEDARTGRRRIVHLARSIAAQKRTESIVNRMLEISKQLTDVSTTVARSSPATALSQQEKRVLKGFSEGKSPSTIANGLNISAQTLRNHVHHVNLKLGTHNRFEAVIHALRRRLI